MSERVAVVFPGRDELFGHPDRGKTAGPILAATGRPYLMLDERAGLSGHGGATGGNFALRYGHCLQEFLSAPVLQAGPFACPSGGGGWTVARELLPGLPSQVRVLAGPEGLPPDLASVGGLWYGLLGESIVLWAMVGRGRRGAEPGARVGRLGKQPRGRRLPGDGRGAPALGGAAEQSDARRQAAGRPPTRDHLDTGDC